MLRHRHVSGGEFAVADNLDVRDVGKLLADQFEDRAAEVAGDTLVGFCALESVGQESVVETLAARGEAVDLGHTHCLLILPRRWVSDPPRLEGTRCARTRRSGAQCNRCWASAGGRRGLRG